MGLVPLLDMLTETALRTGCLDALIPAGTRLGMDPTEFFERMLLVIYALGTGAGIRSVAADEHPYSEEDLRYCRCWFLSVAGARQVAKTIANATFTARQSALWGEGTSAVASDSTHFSAYDQNIFTKYHSRYKRAKRGVLIYWTVETAGAMAIYSQHLTCSASEVHAMVEGAMRHETESGLNVVENYNGVNDYIRFGKRGEPASNRREEQEPAMLCLMILQSCLGYINTLMIQDTFAEPKWADVLTDVDRRGLTPLFTTNMTPYGTVQLRPKRRLDLSGPPSPPEA
ncbi:Tn3 family transposase [Streptosporangium sandarakinum]|uniref:Tn3 family transposase n=1 Tax=Streptosporangium sandarakinum TaxID=1260955 RepID=UPI0034368ED0